MRWPLRGMGLVAAAIAKIRMLTDPRPPVLKDYFDPALTRTVRLALTSKMVRVSYAVEEKDMP